MTHQVAGDNRGSLTTYSGFKVVKHKCNLGQVYKIKKGKPVRVRATKPGCGEVCRFKCHTKISSDREIITLSSKESESPNVIDMSHDYGESKDSWFKLDFGRKEERTW